VNGETYSLDMLATRESGWLHSAVLKNTFQLQIKSDMHTQTDGHLDI